MPLFLQDFLIKITIHAGAVFLSKFTLHITIAKCTGYDPASPSSLGAIMDTIKPALRDSRTNHMTGFISFLPVIFIISKILNMHSNLVAQNLKWYLLEIIEYNQLKAEYI
jgi:hypothetical protein